MCDITLDSSAEKSVWPVGWLDEEPTIAEGVDRSMFVVANGHGMAHYGRKQAKFRRNGEDGQSMSLDFYVTKPLVAVRRLCRRSDPQDPGSHRKRNENKTNLSLRRACVMGRGRQEESRKQLGAEYHELPDVPVDYVCFPVKRGWVGGRSTRCPGASDSDETCTAVVPPEGAIGAFAARLLMALFRECGLDQSDVVMKSDGEAAIKAVIDDLAGCGLPRRRYQRLATASSSAPCKWRTSSRS